MRNRTRLLGAFRLEFALTVRGHRDRLAPQAGPFLEALVHQVHGCFFD